MSKKSQPLTRLFILLSLFFLIVAFAPSALSQTTNHNLIAKIQEQVALAGSYTYHASVKQTAIPRPIPEMIGNF